MHTETRISRHTHTNTHLSSCIRSLLLFVRVNLTKGQAHAYNNPWRIIISLLIIFILSLTCFPSLSPTVFASLLPGEDSDSDSDLSMEEERSLSIPSSESEDNVRLRGRIQRRFKRSNHSERLLTEPTHNGTKGRSPL